MSDRLIIGIHSVKEAIKRNARTIDHIFVLGRTKNKRLSEIVHLASKAGITILEVSREKLDERTKGAHQGVVALLSSSEVINQNQMTEQQLFAYLDDNETQFILILDGVTDPHNLGACMRTADAAGVNMIIVPKDKSVSLNPTVRKVASGAAETVKLVSVTNLARCLKRLKQNGFWIVGTAEKAEKSVYEQDFTGAIALVMGSEGCGLRRLTREKCDFLISIPMVGDLSSLNVSVAAGVVLFEAVRQRSGESG